ncbi:hypothetical protein [Kaistella sp.]|uniref:hypothetical protein n=1 Tax=Kaistella sp. TaxID=2782235 RepID=UPI00359FB150
MNKFTFLIFFLLQIFPTAINAQKAQNQNSNFVQIQEENGDFNNDGHVDKTIISIDTVRTTRPILLQIFLSQPNGELKLAVSSTKIIEEMYPAHKNGKTREFQIPIFVSEDGLLKMLSEIKGGMASYQFKYRKGNFELIHVSKSTWDGKNTTIESEYNLSDGTKIEIEKNLGSEKIVNKKIKKMPLKPLIKIQDLLYSDLTVY